MNALVTGGAGFIGSTLVDRLLAEGHAVDVVDDLSTGSLANLAEARSDRSHRLKVHQVDIRSPEVVELIGRRAPEVVFHLAARPGAEVDTNVLGSVNVLEGARVAGARKVVYAATAAEPPALHAVSKGVVVEYLQAYRTLHDLEYTALGLANVYGPRQRRGVVAEFAERLLAGEPCTLYGDGRQTRDHVFVDDVVDAFVRAGQRGSGVLCNVGTGVETATRDLHAAMAAQAGVTDAEVVLAPARPGDTARSVLDPGRASIHLGWAPWTSLADGLAQVLRENLHNR